MSVMIKNRGHKMQLCIEVYMILFVNTVSYKFTVTCMSCTRWLIITNKTALQLQSIVVIFLYTRDSKLFRTNPAVYLKVTFSVHQCVLIALILEYICCRNNVHQILFKTFKLLLLALTAETTRYL